MAMLHFILHRWIQAKQGCAASHPRLRPKYLRAAWTVRQQRQPRTPAAIKCPTLVGLGGGGGATVSEANRGSRRNGSAPLTEPCAVPSALGRVVTRAGARFPTAQYTLCACPGSAGQPRLSFDSELRRRGHPLHSGRSSGTRPRAMETSLRRAPPRKSPRRSRAKHRRVPHTAQNARFPRPTMPSPEWTGCGRCVSLHSTVACRAAQRRSSPTRSAPDELQPGVTSHGMAFEGP